MPVPVRRRGDILHEDPESNGDVGHHPKSVKETRTIHINSQQEHKFCSNQVTTAKYNFFTYENDIALVKVENRVRFADNIIPICLPGNDDLLIGKFGDYIDI